MASPHDMIGMSDFCLATRNAKTNAIIMRILMRSQNCILRRVIGSSRTTGVWTGPIGSGATEVGMMLTSSPARS